MLVKNFVAMHTGEPSRQSVIAGALIYASDTIDRAIDLIPAGLRGGISSALGYGIAGASVAIPFLYAMSDATGSFMDAD